MITIRSIGKIHCHILYDVLAVFNGANKALWNRSTTISCCQLNLSFNIQTRPECRMQSPICCLQANAFVKHTKHRKMSQELQQQPETWWTPQKQLHESYDKSNLIPNKGFPERKPFLFFRLQALKWHNYTITFLWHYIWGWVGVVNCVCWVFN